MLSFDTLSTMSYPMDINCTMLSSQLLQCGNNKYTIGDHLDHTDSKQFFIDIGIVAGLVTMAGMIPLPPTFSHFFSFLPNPTTERFHLMMFTKV